MRSVGLSLYFVLGFSTVFVILGAGVGVSFLVEAVFTDTIACRIGSIGRAGRVLYKHTGVVMVLMGIAIMTGQLTRFAYWLLVNFPVLGRIGYTGSFPSDRFKGFEHESPH